MSETLISFFSFDCGAFLSNIYIAKLYISTSTQIEIVICNF